MKTLHKSSWGYVRNGFSEGRKDVRSEFPAVDVVGLVLVAGSAAVMSLFILFIFLFFA